MPKGPHGPLPISTPLWHMPIHPSGWTAESAAGESFQSTLRLLKGHQGQFPGFSTILCGIVYESAHYATAHMVSRCIGLPMPPSPSCAAVDISASCLRPTSATLPAPKRSLTPYWRHPPPEPTVLAPRPGSCARQARSLGQTIPVRKAVGSSGGIFGICNLAVWVAGGGEITFMVYLTCVCRLDGGGALPNCQQARSAK